MTWRDRHADREHRRADNHAHHEREPGVHLVTLGCAQDRIAKSANTGQIHAGGARVQAASLTIRRDNYATFLPHACSILATSQKCKGVGLFVAPVLASLPGGGIAQSQIPGSVERFTRTVSYLPMRSPVGVRGCVSPPSQDLEGTGG